MSGYYQPIGGCDRECALVNHCRTGGLQCEKCGRWYCAYEVSDGVCVNCETDDEESEVK